jgi:Transcriptional regulators
VASGVALYAKLASTLRHRIARGDWKLGDQLPTVEALAAEMDLGKVTVRQAYAILAAEGLIESRRGRGTHVSGMPPSRNDGLRSAINSEEVDTADLQIVVLALERDLELPAFFQEQPRRKTPYVRLRKLHVHRNIPFCYAEMYVQQAVFDRFPKGAEHTSKINRLIRDAVPAKADLLRQRITVEPASDVVARLLHYEMAAPLAVVRRSLRSKRGEVLSAGDFFYRSDQFVLESEVPASLTEIYPSLSIPERRTR